VPVGVRLFCMLLTNQQPGVLYTVRATILDTWLRVNCSANPSQMPSAHTWQTPH
jgi:hypothetical protein